MTDKEIIKALECCYRKGGTPCRDCPFNEFEDCNDVLTKKCAYFRSWFSGAWEEVKKSAEEIRK